MKVGQQIHTISAKIVGDRVNIRSRCGKALSTKKSFNRIEQHRGNTIVPCAAALRETKRVRANAAFENDNKQTILVENCTIVCRIGNIRYVNCRPLTQHACSMMMTMMMATTTTTIRFESRFRLD
jgi:hypothetical protein